MNKKLQDKWIKALKSGKYNQTSSALRKNVLDYDDEAFCCLGVLCEIQGFKRVPDGGYSIPVDAADLPNCSVSDLCNDDNVEDVRIQAGKIVVDVIGAFPLFIQKSLGLDKKVKDMGTTMDIQRKLIRMNDDGEPFEKIAAYLEKVRL